MPRIPTAGVTRELLDSLFDEFNIWGKIDDGRLTSESVAEKDAPSRQWPNAMSRIIKHFMPDGKHIATTHCILNDEGHVFHWDAKDFRMYDVRLWRF